METPHITLAHTMPLFHCSLSGWRPLTSPWLTPRHYFIVLSQDGDPSHHPGSCHAIISLFSLRMETPHITLAHATPLFYCSLSGWRPLTSPWLTPRHYFIVLSQDGDPSHHPGSRHAIISLFSLRMETPHITLAHATPLFHCSLSGWRPLTSPWLTPRHYFIVLSQDGDPSHHPGSHHAIISLFSLRMETPHITLAHTTPLFQCSLSGWRPVTSPWLTPRHYFIVLSQDGDPSHHPGSYHAFICPASCDPHHGRPGSAYGHDGIHPHHVSHNDRAARWAATVRCLRHCLGTCLTKEKAAWSEEYTEGML